MLIDECQNFATADLCRALDQGRELGLHCVLAHQYLEQLKQEEQSGLLFHSVLNCARTKVIFGGLSTQELELLTPEVMIDQYDPYRVKDELHSLECEPMESTREIVTQGETASQNLTQSKGTSQGRSSSRMQSAQYSQGRAVGMSRNIGTGESHSETDSSSVGMVNTVGRGMSLARTVFYRPRTPESQLRAQAGESVLENGDTIESSGRTESVSESESSSVSTTTSESEMSSRSDVRTVGHAISHGVSTQRSMSESETTSVAQGISEGLSEGVQESQNHSLSKGLTQGNSTRNISIDLFELTLDELAMVRLSRLFE